MRAVRERGVAMIIVLLLVALMSLVAVGLSGRTQLAVQQASNRSQYEQAWWYALGGERLARGLIEAALEQDGRHHLRQAWASRLLAYPIDGGMITLRVRDERACFNVNALTTLATPQDGSEDEADEIRWLRRLMVLLGGDEQNTAQLIEPLRDWLDADPLTTGLNGAEDLYYTAQSPPYLPANGPLVDLSELNLIQGFRAADRSALVSGETDLIDALRPLLCALPDTGLSLNINTLEPAQAPVLAALLGDVVPLEDVAAALEERPAEGWERVDELWNALLTTDERRNGVPDTVKQRLRVDSDFFLVRIEVTYYDANIVLYSRVRVEEGKPRTWLRHYGALNG